MRRSRALLSSRTRARTPIAAQAGMLASELSDEIPSRREHLKTQLLCAAYPVHEESTWALQALSRHDSAYRRWSGAAVFAEVIESSCRSLARSSSRTRSVGTPVALASPLQAGRRCRSGDA